MTVTWVLESNVFDEACFDRMVAHAEARGIPYHVVRVIPFAHEIDGPVPQIDGPCVVYGSIGIQKLAKTHGWRPGVFGGADIHSEGMVCNSLKDLYLNSDAVFLKMSMVERFLAATVLAHPEGRQDIFIKPDSDTKEFAGAVISADGFDRWYKWMIDIGYLTDNDFEVAISEPKDIGVEWRTVVVDGKISDCCIYKQYQKVMPQRHILPEVEALIYAAHERYAPAPVYVIDIAQVGDEFKVIEYNTFNSAGLYALDVARIMDDVNAYVMKHA